MFTHISVKNIFKSHYMVIVKYIYEQSSENILS